MKTMFVCLLAWGLVVSASAQHVIDRAGVLNGRAARLEAKLKNSKCYVEFLVSVPARQNIRTYGNAEVHRLVNGRNGFVILVTSQPREWWISQWPLDLVSPNKIQEAGDTMVERLHQGDYFGGALAAVKVLEPDLKNPDDDDWWWILLIVCVSLGALLAFGVLLWIIFRPAPTPPPQPMRQSVPPPVNTPPPPPATDPRSYRPTYEEEQRARQIYGQYSPQERVVIVNQYANSPYYYPGCWEDPWLFYFLLLSNDHFVNYGYGPTIINESFGPTIINESYGPTIVNEIVAQPVVNTPVYEPPVAEPPSDSRWENQSAGNDFTNNNSGPDGAGGSWGSDSGSSSGGSDSGPPDNDSSGGGGNW